MLAPKERERLLAAMVHVYAEQGEEQARAAARANGDSAIFAGAFGGMFSAEEEELVAAVNAALAEIVAAVSGAAPEGEAPAPSAIVAALGGAEMVTRGEIMAGQADRLPQLLPGFAYLVTLPYLGEPDAVRLSERARELLGGTDGE